MSVDCFLDTNVLVYALSSAPDEAAKKAVALELIEGHDFGLSAQVLQELYVALTRTVERTMAPEDVVSLLDGLRRFPLVPTDYPLVVAGIEASLRFGISYWDGAIIAAADRLGALVLFTEDLSHGRRYGSVRAVNPFRAGDEVHEGESPAYG